MPSNNLIIFIKQLNWSGVLQQILKYCQSQSQSYITTDRQSASLSWCQAPIWDPHPIFLVLSLIISSQLRVYLCGAPSLTRGLVYSFQFLMDIASAVFIGSESQGTHDHILLSIFETPLTWRPGFLHLFPTGTGYPSCTPTHWVCLINLHIIA
jgi:hypothetical protein